jgi:competence ComEA-like helix-hairpin-helix protein
MLNLTREEEQVVLFLVVIALLGAGLNFLAKKFSPVRAIACANPSLGKININTADKLTLKLIPGVGEKLAERILDYRKENKRFNELEDLRQIKGFSRRTLEKARDLIFIE